MDRAILEAALKEALERFEALDRKNLEEEKCRARIQHALVETQHGRIAYAMAILMEMTGADEETS